MAGNSSRHPNKPVTTNVRPPGGQLDASSTSSEESRGNRATRLLSNAGKNFMAAMTGSPTKTNGNKRRRIAVDASPEKQKTRKNVHEARPTTPTPVNVQNSTKLSVTTQDTTNIDYDGENEDEEMYGEDTMTIDNASMFNHPAKLTEEQMVNNIAVGLEDTINMARIAREAGLGNILKHARISELINQCMAEATNEGLQKQIQVLQTSLDNIAGKLNTMEDTLNQKIQTQVESLERRTTSALKEIKEAVDENHYRINKRLQWIEEISKCNETHKTNGTAKATSEQITKNLENETHHKTQTSNKPDTAKTNTPTNPTAAYHPSRAIIAYQQGIEEYERLPPAVICETLNAAIAGIHKEKDVQIVAARYTQHGNIIVNTRTDQNAHDFVKIAEAVVPKVHPGKPAAARADIKWWKVQVDGIPTRHVGLDGQLYPHGAEAVHIELTRCNPGYAGINEHVLAKPRWLRTTEELQAIPNSSVVFAVDDEEVAKTLLKNGRLAAFGRYCTLRPFQDRPPVIQCNNCWGWEHRAQSCKILPRCRLCSATHKEEEHIPGPCNQCRELAETAGDTLMINEDCSHRLKCTNCTIEGREDVHHAADNRRCPTRLEKWGTARANEKKAINNNEPWKVVKPKSRAREKKKVSGKKGSDEPNNTIASQNSYSALENLESSQTDSNSATARK